MDSPWGRCKGCRWWQIEPGVSAQDTTGGVCIEKRLQPFLLRVSGNSGCNRFEAGEPARRRGSSAAPPEKSVVTEHD